MHTLLAKKFGLHPTDWKCGEIVARAGRITAGELADVTGMSTGAITTVIDRLEQAGLVLRERGDDDRRKVFITTNAARQAEVHGVMLPFVTEYANSLGNFTDEELEIVLRFQLQTAQLMQSQIQRMREND